ncbi:MAG: HPP family protein [Gammaproteobacteria bacterium]|nr:HPP family protein [Gammaproteobacteria bacterium]
MLWKETLKLFGPGQSTVSIHEKIISALAGLAGIGLIMAVSQYFLDAEGMPWVVASMGASAVLLFAVPQGPLSQPWSFVGGHLFSAFIGITIAKLIADPVLASALAVSLAIFIMYLTGSLHPPGGATALTAVIGGTGISELGYWYVLTPVSLNLLVMLVWAVIINNLLPNRCYPNGIRNIGKLPSIQSKDLTSDNTDHQTHLPNLIHRSDLHDALTEMDVFVDVSEDELSKIFNLSLMHTHKKKMGEILCQDIMFSPVTTVDYDTGIETVWQLMIEKRVHAFPVVDKVGHVLGVISLADFLNQVDINSNSGIMSQLNEFIKKTASVYTHKPEYAGHLMSKPAITIQTEQHILDLFELFYSHNIHHLPVLDNNKRLVGIITPKDLLQAFQNTVQ